MTSPGGVDRKRLFEALVALREAADPSAPTLRPEWRDISRWLEATYGRADRDHADVLQLTLIRVLEKIRSLEAGSPPQAEKWLRTVYERKRIDLFRKRSRNPVEKGLRVVRGGDDEPSPIERLRAADRSPDVDEDEVLGDYLRQARDAVDRWLESRIADPTKRFAARRRAEVAILAGILERGYDEIVAAIGEEPPPSKAALYKWVERGREQVLLPALAEWVEALEDETALAFALELRRVLESSRRSDAGKPRPSRRKVAEAVSPAEDCTSIQPKPRRRGAPKGRRR